MRVDVKARRNFRNHRDLKGAAARDGLQRYVSLRLKHAGRGWIGAVLRSRVDGEERQYKEHGSRKRARHKVAARLARHTRAHAEASQDVFTGRVHMNLDGHRAAKLLGENA